MKYCSQCGERVSLTIPPDDDRQRFVCEACAHIHYENPRLVVCTVPRWGDRVLLCKRAIEPRYGLWTLPGGFLENGETTLEGALRETVEEAGAQVRLEGLYTLYNLPHIDQVHLFFLASLRDLDFKAGKESLEAELFTEDEVPWREIAFAAVADTLRHYFADRARGHFPLRVSDVAIAADQRRIITPHFPEPV